MNGVNAFGIKIPDISDILNDRDVAIFLEQGLIAYFRKWGYNINTASGCANAFLQIAKDYVTRKRVEMGRGHLKEGLDWLSEYEKDMRNRLGQLHKQASHNPFTSVSPLLDKRADLIFKQIEPSLTGIVLDLGCGDGRIAKRIAKHKYRVDASDVKLDDNIPYTNLPFILVTKKWNLPCNLGQYDTTLLLTVLHHSENPLKTLQLAKSRTKPGGRIIVIESVYGIDCSDTTTKSALENIYLGLNPEQQLMANIFFDHFYNRIIHYSDDPLKKVNVPYNFNTPAAWKEIFERHGLKQEQVIHLGIDQPTVPEYHTLHVLRKT
ncbi:methyltransferase domain-containing protein [Candidatus Woesearchaeota archaeon]|nr:methyltransferase domain-containing protein [Candidatus Woesearchaeota archaeon]